MTKWIKVKDGHWKTVPDDYNAPTDEPADKPGVPNLITKPPWATYEAPMHTTDGEENVKASEAFFQERTKWTQSSKKWDRYEHSRKATLAKDKPLWRKKMAEKGAL